MLKKIQILFCMIPIMMIFCGFSTDESYDAYKETCNDLTDAVVKYLDANKGQVSNQLYFIKDYVSEDDLLGAMALKITMNLYQLDSVPLFEITNQTIIKEENIPVAVKEFRATNEEGVYICCGQTYIFDSQKVNEKLILEKNRYIETKEQILIIPQNKQMARPVCRLVTKTEDYLKHYEIGNPEFRNTYLQEKEYLRSHSSEIKNLIFNTVFTDKNIINRFRVPDKSISELCEIPDEYTRIIEWIRNTSNQCKDFQYLEAVLTEFINTDISSIETGDIAFHVTDGFPDAIGIRAEDGEFYYYTWGNTVIKKGTLDVTYCVKLDAAIVREEYGCSSEEAYLLAQLIAHEARGECVKGRVAVGEVVLNRINSSLFPQAMDITSTVYSPGQFEGSEKISNMVPSEENIHIAEYLLSGKIRAYNNPDVLYFRKRTNEENADWGNARYYDHIENHNFYTQVILE